MKHYVGLDVLLKEVSICVVDVDGTVIAEGEVATECGHGESEFDPFRTFGLDGLTPDL